MAYNVAGLTAYIEDQDFPLAYKMQAQGGLAEFVSIQTGIKGSSNLQFMTTDVVFGADGCSRTASGTTTLTKRTLAVGSIAISEDLCVKTLNGYWLQTQLKQGVAGDLEIPFEQQYMDKKMNELKHQLAISDFQGDTLSGTNNLSYYDGLLKIVDAEASVVDGNTGGVTVAAGVTVANVLAILDAMWLEVPEEISEKTNLSLWLPYSIYRLYKLALKNANLFHYKGEDGIEKLYGTNVTLRPTVGLTGITRMVLSADDNITIGMDGQSDDEDFKTRLNPATDKSIFFDVTFRRGVQIAFPDEIVEFTLVP